ncbi:intermembrane lipid transfer protein VPS13A-like [Tubulanus polymorphus]|uniref:intermembrane lipid transfer protein VPS13A-like n=1 Tax=Tubulanus polymorphus TaxID=672921 RepID=UPI003DA2B4FE
MVFESIIVDLLNKYLGDYVENLDRSQLKLGIWGGDVVLGNLDVKASALDDLDLPIKIRYGHLGKLVLKIPWTNLYTEPVVVTVEDVYVVAVPNQGVKYDAEKEEKSAQDSKQKELTRIEEAEKAAAEEKGKKHLEFISFGNQLKKNLNRWITGLELKSIDVENKPKEVKKDSFAEKFATQVIKNLQVIVNRIHVRYEDRFTNPAHPISIGVTLDKLSFETTNDSWKPCIIKEAVSTIHKLVQLDCLSLYWNSDTALYSELPKEQLLVNSIASATNKTNLNYVLNPIRSKVQLTLNTKPEALEFTVPKILLNVVFEEIGVHLSKKQYQNVLEMLESVERMQLTSVYRKYGRPDVPYKGHAKEWWHYAYTCTMEGNIKRRKKMWSWQNMKAHRDRLKRYKDMYKKRLLNKKLSKDESKDFEECEKLMDVMNITLVRQQAKLEAKREGKKSGGGGGWFKGWFGGNKGAEDKKANEIQEEFYKAMTPEEKAKLYGAIGYQENAVDENLPVDYVAHKFLFRLNAFSLTLEDEELVKSPEILKLSLTDVYANIGQRPAASALRVDAKMDALDVQGMARKGKSPPRIVSSQNSEEDRIFSLLDVQFETNPLDGEADTRIRVCARPLEIIYDAHTINQIANFFKPPESVRLKQLSAAAMSKFEEFKEISATGLQHAIQEHKYTDISIDVKPSYVIVPEKGVYTKDVNCLILDLGNLTVVSEKNQVPEVGELQQMAFEDVIERAYDRFNIELQSVQLLYAKSGGDWQSARQQNNSPMHILRPMKLALNVHKSMIMNDARIPKMKVVGELPLLSLNMSDHRLQEIIKLGQSIPLPEPSPDFKETVVFESDDLPAEVALTKINVPAVPKAPGYESSSDESSDEGKKEKKKKSDEEETPDNVQCTDLKLTFVIKEICLNVFQRQNGLDIPTIKLVIDTLGTEVEMRTFDMRVNTYLGGLYLQHLQFKALENGPLINLVNTPIREGSGKKLLSIQYVKADKKGPDFATIYEHTEQSIEVHFTALEVMLHQEALLHLMEFTKALEPPPAPPTEIPVTRRLSSVSGNLVRTISESKLITKARRRKIDPDLIDLKVTAKLDEFSVGIASLSSFIADIKIEGLKTEVEMRKDKIKVNVGLKDLIVFDPTPNVLYPKILSMKQGEMLDAEIVVFNEATDGANYSNMHVVDTSIVVRFGCMQVIFLNKFVSNLLRFSDNFQAAKAKMAEASDALAETAAEQAKNLHEKATRVSLDIELQAPEIIVPQNSSSPNVLILDLGRLSLKNKFKLGERKSRDGSPAIFDCMTIELSNLKIIRSILSEGVSSTECLILEPVSIELNIIRNLTFSWYTDFPEMSIKGKMNSVILTLSQDDFTMLMLVLNENITEGQPPPSPAEPVSPSTDTPTTPAPTSGQQLDEKVAETIREDEELVVASDDKVFSRLELAFTIERTGIMLYLGTSHLACGTGLVCRDPEKTLASFALKKLNVGLDMKTDSSMTAEVYMVTMELDDTRPGALEKITRGHTISMIERAGTGKEQQLQAERAKLQKELPPSLQEDATPVAGDGSEKRMLQLNFNQDKEMNKEVTIDLTSLYICVCLEFLLTLGDFFTKGMPKPPELSEEEKLKQKEKLVAEFQERQKQQQQQKAVTETVPAAAPPTGDLMVQIRIIDPEIVLVEDPMSKDSQALILDTQVSFKMRQTSDTQNMLGSVSKLQIYAGPYDKDKRIGATTQIMSPCDMSLVSNAPSGKDHHIDINMTDLILTISPQTLQTITKISAQLSAGPTAEELKDGEYRAPAELWAVKKISDLNLWFININKDADIKTELMALEPAIKTPTRGEQLMMTIASIVIKLEAGQGRRTVPMLMLEAGFNADVRDWSSELFVTCSMKCEVAYYNERLAVWEPLLEPVEEGQEQHRPWEMSIEIHQNDEVPLIDPDDPEVDQIITQPPKMVIDVKSSDMLQITVSKSLLELLTSIGKAFSDAYYLVDTKVQEAEIIAPYCIINDSGLSIKLKPDVRFQPVENAASNQVVALESGEKLPLHNLENEKKKKMRKMQSVCTSSQQESEERKMLLMVEQFGANRELIIQKAETRSFNINQQSYPGDIWALICQTEAKLGCKNVTLRSIIQVQNHLPVGIDLFYKTEDGHLDKCGELNQDETFNVPLHVVYTAPNQLYFKPHNDVRYKASGTGLLWRSLKNGQSEVVTCESKQAGYQPFFFNVIPQVDDVLFELTNDKTAKTYTLHLHPTIVFENILPMTIDYILEGTATQISLEAGQKTILYNACVGKTSMEIRILNYRGRDWDAHINFDPNAQELAVWTFEAPDGYSTVTMDLGLHTKRSKGFLEVALYSPYWMVNKTGLPLVYKVGYSSHNSTDDIVYEHPEGQQGAVLFAYKPKKVFEKKKEELSKDDASSTAGSTGTLNRNKSQKKNKQPWKKSGKVTLKVCDSDWSDKFSLDTVGSSGTVTCKFKHYTYEVGVKISLSNSGLTKIVTFTPYYMIVNKATYTISSIEVTNEMASNNAHWVDCPPKECVPFWPIQSQKKMLMKAKVKDTNMETKPFIFNEPHNTLMKLEEEYGGISIETQISESAVIIMLDQYHDGMANVQLVNHTSLPIKYYQNGVEEQETLPAGTTVLYAWQDATGKREMYWQCGDRREKTDLIKDGCGNFFADTNSKVYWVSFLDGLQRVLLFTQDISIVAAAEETDVERVDMDLKVSLKGFGLSLVNNYSRMEIAYLAITSSGVVWEEKRKRYKALKNKFNRLIEAAYQVYQDKISIGETPNPRMILGDKDKVEVDFNELMMYKPHKRQIRRSFQTGIFLQYRTSPHQVQFHAKIHRLQLDSQVPGCVFPTVLAPIPPPKSVAAESVPKPFTEATIMLRKNEHSSVVQFRYFKVLVQEMSVKVDQGFLTQLIGLFASSVPEPDYVIEVHKPGHLGNVDLLFTNEKDLIRVSEKFKEDALMVSSSLMESDVGSLIAEGQKNFYDDLHFSPLKIHISFSLQGSDSSEENGNKSATPVGMNFINLFLQSVGVVLTDVQDVVFKLAFFERKYKFYNQQQLTGEMVSHYSGQAIKQMYVLVLGLDVLGNPFGVIRGVAQGIEDLFYEPYQGAIQGPEEFAEGLALGVRSLIGHAVGGAAGAVSRITGTLGKGLASLTMDEDYQRKRREEMNKRPANVGEGLARGGKGLVMGVVDGVTGIVMRPVEGAKKEGVEGFFKGMGKGLVGAITRPASGVVDFASSSFEVMRRVAENTDEVHRLRPPRFLPPDGILRPYRHREAEGNNVLQETEKGKFMGDKYVAHIVLTKDYKHILLVTNRRLIFVSKGEIFGAWDCDWHYMWSDLKEPPSLTSKGVQILLKEKQKKLFGSSTVGKVVQVTDMKTAEWLVEKIHEAMVKLREEL